MKFLKKYQIVIVLCVVAAIMSVIKIKNQKVIIQNNGEIPETSPAIKPTIWPTSRPTIDEKQFDREYPLWRLLPYSGNGFVANRYIEPLTLMVKAVGVDEKVAAKEIVKWMMSHQVRPESHKIIFE
jgi:hypothetical protein